MLHLQGRWYLNILIVYYLEAEFFSSCGIWKKKACKTECYRQVVVNFINSDVKYARIKIIVNNTSDEN